MIRYALMPRTAAVAKLQPSMVRRISKASAGSTGKCATSFWQKITWCVQKAANFAQHVVADMSKLTSSAPGGLPHPSGAYFSRTREQSLSISSDG